MSDSSYSISNCSGSDNIVDKVIPEHDRMGLVQALTILHHFRDLQRCMNLESELADALDVVFEWIDNAVLLFHKPAHPDKEKKP